MILTSGILKGFGSLSTPQDGDTTLQVPALLMPTIAVPEKLSGNFGSTIASPYSSSLFQQTTALFAFSDSYSAAGPSNPNIGGLAPGVWQLLIDMGTSIISPAAATFYSTTVNYNYPGEAAQFFINSTLSAFKYGDHIVWRGNVAFAYNTLLSLITPAVGAAPITWQGSVLILANRLA